MSSGVIKQNINNLSGFPVISNEINAFNSGRLGYIGPYQLLNRLGNGGMAVVYKACSIHPERDKELVAIKVLNEKAAADPAKAEYFRDEAYLLSTLGHPNLVRTLEAGIHQGQYYLVMQYIDGCDLGTLLDNLDNRNMLLPVPIGLYIIYNLLSALKYIHQANATDGKPLGLVHRDICPANVLLSTSGQVLLSDFGIATHILPRHLHRELNAGHLGYLAPEQINNRTVDKRTDLFAVGVLLYEVITNVQPFFRPKKEDSYWATLEFKPLPAPNIDAELKQKLMPLFKKACNPNPDKRFQTAEQFQEALEETFHLGEGGCGALTSLMNSLYPVRGHDFSKILNENKEEKEQFNEVVQLYSLDKSAPDGAQRLLHRAGYATLKLPFGQTPDPNTPLLISAEDVPSSAILPLINNHHAPLVILLGSFTEKSLTTAAELGHQCSLFAPYNVERISLLLHPTTTLKSRFNTLELNPHMSLFQQIKLLNRRVLLIGWPAVEAAICCMVLEKWRVYCHAVATLQEALDLAAHATYNLVLLSPNLADEAISIIADLREQTGYSLLPVLLPTATPKEHLMNRESDAIFCDENSSDMEKLSQRILMILLNNNIRSFLRYRASLPTKYSYLGVAQEGTLVNIGRLGGLLLSKQIVPIGAELHLKFAINEEEGKYIDIDKAQVVHIALEEDRLGGNVLIGLSFGGMSEANEQDWLSFIYDQENKSII